MTTAATAEVNAEAKAANKAALIALGRLALADGLVCNPHPMTEDELLHKLKESVALFDKGKTDGDGGRAGMIQWIRTLSILALSHLSETRDWALLMPGQCLLAALEDLDCGNVHPALQSAVLPHAHKPSHDVRVLKVLMLVAADMVYAAGRRADHSFTRKQADKEVRERFGETALRLGVKLTAQKLETWRREVRASRNAHDVLAISDEMQRRGMEATVSHLAKRGVRMEDRLQYLVKCANYATSARGR